MRYSAHNSPSDIDFYGEGPIGTCPVCLGDTDNFKDDSDEFGESKAPAICDECLEAQEAEEQAEADQADSICPKHNTPLEAVKFMTYCPQCQLEADERRDHV